jgi:conjugative relaxase-like TrwC/TraI family protein
VLTIGKLGASPDQLAYYEQQVARGLEDYLSGRGESPGRWIGVGCDDLGVVGQVDREGFMRAMAGCDPRTGALLRPPRARSKVAGFDLTFSAPKSVSVLFAVAGEEVSAALLEAHERAVEEAFAYVEREACFTRRGHAGAQRVRGDGLVAAAYRHRLSRAGDPQLHTHVVVANLTRAEGRWTTLEAHRMYEHALAAGAVYRAVLRVEVRERLGWVWWRPVSRGLFEIEGMPDGVLRAFSRRRVEIEDRARELAGVAASELSRARLQGIALATRRAKEYGVDGARWREEARARAAEHGLGPRELDRLMSAVPGSGVASELDGSVVERLSARDGLTGKHNTFVRRHALAEIAGEFAQGAAVAELEGATGRYLEDASVVALGGGNGEERFTTRDLLAAECAIVATARRRVGREVAMLPRMSLEESRRRGEVELNAEQAAAVEAIAGSGNGVDMLQALAGTGKTRVLGALAGCYRDAGYLILGVAPTGRAARELGEAISEQAHTLHAVVAAIDRAGGLLPGTVVLMDEAGMAPTRQSAVLFAAAERAGAKLIAAGDSGQLPSVQAGGWFAALTRGLGGPALREVMRQRDPEERAALEALHDGDAERYIAFKQAQGALRVHADEPEALAGVLGTWEDARRAHGLRSVVMIAPDNVTRGLLNELARATLIETGELSADGVRIGDREFRVGDRVIARRNDRDRDVDNGTLATVRGIHGTRRALIVETDAGGRRELDADYVADHVEQALALTGHATQGATVERAIVVGRASDFTAEWAYTALSRARGRTELHVIAEPSPARQERGRYGPRDPQPALEDTLDDTRRALLRRLAEPLAIEHVRETESWRPDAGAQPLRPSGERGEAASPSHDLRRGDGGAEARRPAAPEPGWCKLQRRQEAIERARHLQR